MDTYEKKWDEFVLNESINGTFLQTRNFLNYHPKNRFRDTSLMVYDAKGRLSAVIPACEEIQENKKVFYSHKGSTFGGIVISKKKYKAESVLDIIDSLKRYLQENNYDKVILKNTSDIFSLKRMDLLEFACHFHGFKEYKELSTYVDYTKYSDNVESNFSRGKHSCINRCKRYGLTCRELLTDSEVGEFYEILCINLKKYNTIPVHTLEELLDLKNNRLKNRCTFFGCFDKEKMVAGTMLFYFETCKTAHTQYLAALPKYDKWSPMSFVYYRMICEMRMRGFQRLSFGIATENMGQQINYGLLRSKEGYGSLYSNNYTYVLDLK